MMLQLSTSDWNVSAGDANANDGFHSIQMRNCQKPRKMAMARSFGHAPFQILRPSETFAAIGTSSASRPDVSARSSMAMPTHLVLQTVSDGPRLLGDLGGVEAARSVDGNGVLLDDAAGPTRQQDHAVTEAH